jgi:hypothetical protein
MARRCLLERRSHEPQLLALLRPRLRFRRLAEAAAPSPASPLGAPRAQVVVGLLAVTTRRMATMRSLGLTISIDRELRL